MEVTLPAAPPVDDEVELLAVAGFLAAAAPAVFGRENVLALLVLLIGAAVDVELDATPGLGGRLKLLALIVLANLAGIGANVDSGRFRGGRISRMSQAERLLRNLALFKALALAVFVGSGDAARSVNNFSETFYFISKQIVTYL